MNTKSKSTNSNKANKQQNETQNTGTQNRTEQLSGTETQKAETAKTATQDAPVRPYVNFAERDFNRKLSVDKVLEKLERFMPAQFELAEVVGKWIWISFPEPPAERVRADLSQLGFHWNNTRKCWQHPCGETLPRGQQEPQQKYDVWFPHAMAAKRAKEREAQQIEKAAA